MKKKQQYNALQLSFFDEVKALENNGNDKLLDRNWKNVISNFENEKQPTNNLNNENNERDLTTETGQAFMMVSSEETKLKSELPWKGRVLYDMLKEQQPERFLQMKQSGELIPFLKRISQKYYDQMNHHIIDNGMIETEAEELEWPKLTMAAALS
jgi:hypothetical protein